MMLLLFLCSALSYAQDSEIPGREFEDGLEEAVRLHDERKFSLADDRYVDMLASLMARQDSVSSDLFEAYMLNYIDNCLAVRDFRMATLLLETPVEYSPEGQVAHSTLLGRTVRKTFPKHYLRMREWLEYADSLLLSLKAEDVVLQEGLELGLLNEKGNFYGTADMPDSLFSVIDRIQDIAHGRMLSYSDWPADAYYWYALEVARGGDFRKAVSILEDVVDYKINHDINDVYAGIIALAVFARVSGQEKIVGRNIEKVLAAVDKEMSLQAICMPPDMFYLYFQENLLIDAIVLAASVTAPECNDICYDAVLTIRNLRCDVQKELLAFSAEYSDNDFARLWTTMRETGLSGYSRLLKASYDEAADRESPFLCRDHRKSWQDVRNALSPGEAAVEFIQVPDRKPYYAALVIRRDSDAPAFVRLCAVSELDSELKKGLDIYRNGASDIYGLVWGPLEEYLRRVRTVFYSPVGDLLTVNMEAIMTEDGAHLLSERYNLGMVSSTASILDTRPKPRYGGRFPRPGLLAFGGLDYYPDNELWYEAACSVRSLRRDAPRCMFDRSDYRVEELMSDMQADTVRAGLDFLEHSLEEVNGIADLLPRSNCFLKTGLNGIEENFRIDYHTEIVHLATHAFYFDEDEVYEDERLAGFDLSFVTTAESSALKRCGLLFSGAGVTVAGKKPDGVFDGLVFGEDIAGRDFSKTDLVVLSACGTGLGDIRPDGVYGLRLAFKRSGVRTMVMSLWDVNDESTSLMMTTFYRHLMSGDGKRKAFRKARETVRKKYHDPYYWAPFVMVD